MIAVVDYGMGNLRSVEKALVRSGADVTVTSDAARILEARGVVLPGVGAFGACMENLRQRGLVEPVRQAVSSGKPFFGICLGLQLLFDESEEFGPVAGLGLFRGRVRRFAGPAFDALKVPQMGWNRLRVVKPAVEVDGLDQAYVYFVHSYYVEPADPALVCATTTYGVEFASAIAHENVFACQFHPEKSQAAGLGILERFVRRVAAS